MISTFTSARATRWAGGVLVAAASAFSIGVVGPIATASAATAPTVITISPTSETIATHGCAALTVHATPLAAGQPITIQATESSPVGASPLSTCTPSGGSATTALSNAVVGGSAGLPPIIAPTNGTATMRFYGTTDANGDILVGVSSTLAGSLTAVAYYNSTDGIHGVDAAPVASNPTSNTATVNVLVGGAAAVSKLTVTPTAATQYVGSGVTYTVATADVNAVPIGGIEVDYVMSGVDTQVPVHQCGVLTDSDGRATCTITNAGTAGTDTITFYVNKSGGTAGPDSGEPQASATATFQALPAGGSFNVSATCSNTDRVAGELAGPPTNPVALACANSTATHAAVAFTGTVLDASNQPVSGVAVDWNRTTISGGPPTIDSSLSSTTCTTGSDGTCSITLTEPHPLNAEYQTISATVASASASATAGWKDPHPQFFDVTPPLQTVTNGGSAGFTATVQDQFGAGVTGQGISYVVTAGRNPGKSGAATTGANGNVSISYTDAAPSSGQPTDTVQFKDTSSAVGGPTNNTVNDTVNYISGSTQAGLMALDVSGNCNTAAPSSTATGSIGTSTTKVCALVTNASGTKLLGKAVTFAVGIGKVGASSVVAATDGPSVTVNTDANGVAAAYVSSTTSGSQSVTAKSDAVTATGSVSYATSVASLSTVKIAPATPTIGSGASQTFTATATDSHGNVISGATLLFTQSGPGALNGGNNQLATTSSAGTASIVLSTASSDTGTGSVTVAVQNDSATQCHNTGGACTAVATYTIKVGAAPATLLLYPQKNVAAGNGNAEGVEAVVLDGNGAVVANQVVRFTVTGANTGSGAVTTNSSGVALFAYNAVHSGTDTISAYDDVNNSNTKDAGEPAASTAARIAPAGSNPGGKEHPSLTVTQSRVNSHYEKLKLTVTSNPKVVAGSTPNVTFYQIKKGVRHKIGTGSTGAKGKSVGTLKAVHGITLKFQVKVHGKPGISSGYSKVVTVHVR